MGFSSHDSPVVVIGAGLAGLAAAVYLVRAGRPVVLVEAGDTHGGCCSTTRVEGFVFNNGAIYVAVPSLLRRAFERLGMDLDAEAPLLPVARPFSSHLEDGSVVHLADRERSYVAGPHGEERTRILRADLDRLQRDWAPVYRGLVDHVLPHGPSPWNALRRLGPHLHKLRGRADALIRRSFADPGIQAAVASLLLYTGVPPERLPASQIIGLLALLEEGFHVPRDGMGAISDALFRHAHGAGVDMRMGQRVECIEVAGGRASGVRLAGGERIAASGVVATTAGFEVVERLLAPGQVPRRLARAARSAPLSHRAVSIQLGGCAPAADGAFIVNHVPALERQGRMHQLQAGRPEWLSYTVPSRVSNGLAPIGKSTIELFAPAPGDRDMPGPLREAEELVARYLEALHHRLPGLSIDTMRVIDPVAFEQDRHLYAGALYGIRPGVPPHRLFPHRSGIPGLHLAGQTTFPGYGVGPAIWSGIQSAEALCRAAD